MKTRPLPRTLSLLLPLICCSLLLAANASAAAPPSIRSAFASWQDVSVSGSATVPAKRVLKRKKAVVTLQVTDVSGATRKRTKTLKAKTRQSRISWSFNFTTQLSGKLKIVVSLKLGSAKAGRSRTVTVLAPAVPRPIVTDLPVLQITTRNSEPVESKEIYLDASISLDPNGHKDVAGFTDSVQIKGRGNSTWNQYKRPYKLKFAEKRGVMGMPENKHWVLLANYLDRSFVRNATAFQLGALTRLAWTPRSQFVELVLNGQYIGLYQLTEQVRIGKDRVDIKEIKPADVSGEKLTGGYLIEIDHRYTEGGEVGFTTSEGVPVAVNDPEEPQPEQLAYIRDYVQDFEDRLFSDDFRDPVLGWAAVVDVDTLVDWYIVNEYTKNADAYFSSSYMYKDRGKKLAFGPLWDFDISAGNPISESPLPPEGWWVADRIWPARLFEDPAFARAVAVRWFQLLPVLRSTRSFIETLKERIGPAAANDRYAWSWAWGEELDVEARFVQDWFTTREGWLSSEFAKTLGALDG